MTKRKIKAHVQIVKDDEIWWPRITWARRKGDYKVFRGLCYRTENGARNAAVEFAMTNNLELDWSE